MAGKQDTLIYIEQDNKIEAEFMSRSFVNGPVKNRAYINALGAELVMKYLASEEIDVSNIYNLHSISKILEKIDISDILLPNIHIDVRVVFDENQIFIPKSHFQLEITPDIYVVLKLAKDFSHVEFLGYFEPKLLNLKLQNSEYYFFEKEKLSSPSTLKQFIKNFPGNTSRGISQEDMLRGRELSIAMADHNITDAEQKELIELLLLSSELRESVLEFDNFETLSYSVGSSFKGFQTSTEQINDTKTTDDKEEDTEQEDNSAADEQTQEENQTEDIDLSNSDEDIVLDESFFDLEETPLDENLQPLETIDQDTENTMQLDVQTETEEQRAIDNDFTTPETNIESAIIDSENNEIEETLQGPDTLTEDTSANQTSQPEEVSTDETQKTEPDKEKPSLEKTIGDAVQKAIEKSAGAAAAAAGLAGAAAAGEALAAGGASQEAIKLAGISGDMVNELINKNLENQQEHLNKIDYSQISTNATEIPEHIAAYDLHAAKIEMDIEAEASGKFDAPKDLSELRTVETKKTLGEEEIFEPETIDLESMETVETEKIYENTESIVDLNTINTIESPTKPIDNLEEKMQENTADEHLSDIDFSNMSTFTINADGTSPIDDIDINFDNNDDENHLVDFGMNSNELIIDDMPLQDNLTTTNESIEADLMLGDSTDNDFTEALMPIEENTLNDEPEQNLQQEEPLTTSELEDSTENLSIDESFEENLTLDDSNLSLDADLSSEDINLTTETTIENLNPVLEEESLNIEEESIGLNTDANQLPEADNVIVDEYIDTNKEPVIESIETLPSQTEIQDDLSADILLDNVIDNIGNDNIEENIPEPFQDNTVIDNESSKISTDIEQPLLDEVQLQPEDNITIEDTLNSTEIDNMLTTPEAGDFETNNIQESDIADNNVIDNVENQDWMSDANYDNLQDIEIPSTPAQETAEDISNTLDELPAEEFITEPDENNEKTYTVTENSTVISDMNFKPGEIPIDINVNSEPQLDGPEQLESLYNTENTVPGAALLKNPGRLGSGSKINNKPGLGIGLGIVGVILSIIIVGIIGFSVSKMLNKQTEETPQPITDDTAPTSPDNGVNDANTLAVDQNNVIDMDNTNNNTPALPAAKPAATQKTTTATPAVKPPVQQKKAASATSFLEINKLTWEIPDYISYNQQFKQYFQAVGKSLKLSLNSDLLLATDYAYSDQVRVSITYAKDGTFKDSKILLSSGSMQIDNIVLQTVNQTLKVLKAPHSVGNDESTTVILKIYF